MTFFRSQVTAAAADLVKTGPQPAAISGRAQRESLLDPERRLSDRAAQPPGHGLYRAASFPTTEAQPSPQQTACRVFIAFYA